MLKQFSRLEKTRSLVIVIFALLMGLSLVFFYAPSGRDAGLTTSAMSREVLAEVRGDRITVGDLDAVKAGYRRQFGGQFNSAMFGGDRRMLDGLVSSRMIAQEAERLGLAPSDTEVRDKIVKYFTNPADGKFVGEERYRQQAVSQYGSIERFERQIRDELAREKLEAFVTAGAGVSGEEVQRDWERQNTKFELAYVPVVVADLAKKAAASDEEVARFYEERKEEFRIGVPQKKIRYVFINQEKVGQKIQLTDEDLRKEFDSLKPENKIAGVRVQQIVLRVVTKELDKSVLDKATQLVAGMRGDDLKATEEKFAEVARGNSEDPSTAKNGGWLPTAVKKDPNRKKDIYQNAIDLQPGQVSDPFYSNNAYYILRRGEQVDKTFEQSRPELLASLRNRRSYASAAQVAQRAAERLKQTKDPEAVARELAAEADMSPAEMVKETGFIKPGDDVPDIGSSPQFEESVAPLNNPQDVGERTGIRNGFAIPMLVEKRDPRVPELAEVRDQVAERVKQEKAKTQLEQAARELAAANSPDELKAVAERLGLKVETSKDYTVGTPLGVAGTSPAADDAIFALRPGNVTKTPIKNGDTWVVVAATNRTDADLAEFGKQRDQLIQSALDRRRSQMFDDYLASLRSRLEREGDIKVNDDVLARLTALEQPATALPAGLPGGTRTIPIAPPQQ